MGYTSIKDMIDSCVYGKDISKPLRADWLDRLKEKASERDLPVLKPVGNIPAELALTQLPDLTSDLYSKMHKDYSTEPLEEKVDWVADPEPAEEVEKDSTNRDAAAQSDLEKTVWGYVKLKAKKNKYRIIGTTIGTVAGTGTGVALAMNAPMVFYNGGFMVFFIFGAIGTTVGTVMDKVKNK